MKGQQLRIEVVFGPDAGLTVQNDADNFTVGTSPDATVVLHDPKAAPVHVEFVCQGGPFFLYDRSEKDDVNVDGNPAREAKLATFAFVELGGTTLRIEKVGGSYVPDREARIIQPAARNPGIRFPDVSEPVAELSDALDGKAALMLGDDLLLVMGGQGMMRRTKSNQVTLVQVSTGQVHALPPLPEPRSFAMATQLADGRVLVTGGGTTSTLLLDPRSWTWTQSGPLGVERSGGALLPLPDGRAFIAGGVWKVGPRASGEVWDPARNAWTPMPPGRTHVYVDSIMLSPRRALLLSRLDHKDPIKAWFVDLEKLSFTALPPLPEGIGRVVMVPLPAERALLLPGDGGDPPRRSVVYVDPAAGTSYYITPRRFQRMGGTGVALPDGRVLVMGGESSQAGLYTAEMYDPQDNSWEALPPPRQGPGNAKLFARSDGSAVAVGFQEVRLFPSGSLL
jgi:hypothetical protein